MNRAKGKRRSSASQGLMRKKSARLLVSTPSISRRAICASVFRRGATTSRSANRSTCRICGALRVSVNKLTKVTTAVERRTMAFMGDTGVRQPLVSANPACFIPAIPLVHPSFARLQEFEERKPVILDAVRNQLRGFRIFRAGMGPEPRILERLEAAIMNALYNQLPPLCDIPDRGMHLAPRWASETSILIKSHCAA